MASRKPQYGAAGVRLPYESLCSVHRTLRFGSTTFANAMANLSRLTFALNELSGWLNDNRAGGFNERRSTVSSGQLCQRAQTLQLSRQQRLRLRHSWRERINRPVVERGTLASIGTLSSVRAGLRAHSHLAISHGGSGVSARLVVDPCDESWHPGGAPTRQDHKVQDQRPYGSC
jgi:hypothetical protein